MTWIQADIAVCICLYMLVCAYISCYLLVFDEKIFFFKKTTYRHIQQCMYLLVWCIYVICVCIQYVLICICLYVTVSACMCLYPSVWACICLYHVVYICVYVLCTIYAITVRREGLRGSGSSVLLQVGIYTFIQYMGTVIHPPNQLQNIMICTFYT